MLKRPGKLASRKNGEKGNDKGVYEVKGMLDLLEKCASAVGKVVVHGC